MKPTQRGGFFTGSQRLFDKSKMSSSTATVQASTSRHTQLGRETGDGRGGGDGEWYRQPTPNPGERTLCVLPSQCPAPAFGGGDSPEGFPPDFLEESPAEELGQGYGPGPTGSHDHIPTLLRATFLEAATVPHLQ